VVDVGGVLDQVLCEEVRVETRMEVVLVPTLYTHKWVDRWIFDLYFQVYNCIDNIVHKRFSYRDIVGYLSMRLRGHTVGNRHFWSPSGLRFFDFPSFWVFFGVYLPLL